MFHNKLCVFITQFLFYKNTVYKSIEIPFANNLRIISEYSSGSLFCIVKIFCQCVFKFSFLPKTFLLQKLISASPAGSFSYFQPKMTLFCSLRFILLYFIINLLQLLSLHKSLVYPPFIYILYGD